MPCPRTYCKVEDRCYMTHKDTLKYLITYDGNFQFTLEI